MPAYGFCASIELLPRRNLILVFLCLLIPARAFAQTAEPGAPPSTVRLQFGPLFLNPLIGLTNIGVDNNVFNDPETGNPQQDFTMTVVPAVDLWLRFGRTWVTSTVREDLVYYQKFESERSANTNIRLNWLIPFNRLILNPGIAYVHTRERPGFEIDTRARRTEMDYNGSAELRVASKTFVGVRGDRRTTDFQQGQEYDGTDLHDELNRTVTSGAVTVRYQATPLTAITIDAVRQRDRFEFSPDRDADSTQLTAGVKFDPAALIKGSAAFGYKDFNPVALAVPGYKGSIAGVDIAYVPLDSTRLTLTLGRDVRYSVRRQPAVLPADRRDRFDQSADLRTRGRRRAHRGTAAPVPATGWARRSRCGIGSITSPPTAAASAITWDATCGSVSTSTGRSVRRPWTASSTTACGSGSPSPTAPE